MDIRDAIAQAVRSQDLSTEQMTVVMRQIMTGQATPAQIGGLLVALHMKGETVDEIVGAAAVMRELATPVVVSGPNLVDTCGTGGDGANLFNVSTAAALVVAAAGGAVAKHGNRSVSSSTGSSDLLEAAGVTLSLTPEQVARCIESIGVGFMFAPAHHSATKHAVGPRRELALRTLFNLLGPLTNPAGVRRQVIGVFAKRWCRPLAQVLARLGSERVLVVHSADGLDEISIAAETFVAELNDGSITEYEIAPEDFGIKRQPLAGLSVSNAAQSLALIKSALGNEPGELAEKAQDIIALNSGAAIYACGLADTLKEGVARAQDAIGSGLAKEKLTELVAFTGVFSE